MSTPNSLTINQLCKLPADMCMSFVTTLVTFNSALKRGQADGQISQSRVYPELVHTSGRD